MDDTTFEAQKARVEAYFAKWIPLLRLDRQDITINYIREYHESKNPQFETVMDTQPQWRYHHAKINVYLPNYPSREEAWVEEDVVHELVHVMMGPLAELYTYQKGPISGIDEFVTQTLTLAILNTHRADD